MLRRLLLRASNNRFLAGRLPRYRFVRRAVRRFMPGETPGEALDAAARLAEQGASSIVSLLGENVATEDEAAAVVEHYRGVLAEIRARGLDAEISLKLTQLGLDLGTEVAERNLLALLDAAGPGGPTVWIDMESSAYTDATLALFRRARRDHDNVGVCLQAYLRRTGGDLAALLPLRPAIRLVKGAYAETAEVAFPDKAEVDAQLRELAFELLAARRDGRAGRPAIATHDVAIVRDVQEFARQNGIDPRAYEFEMLYGIGTAEQRRIAAAGDSMRVLLSYGTAWFPWYMRRLAERPANLWFVVRSMFRRR